MDNDRAAGDQLIDALAKERDQPFNMLGVKAQGADQVLSGHGFVCQLVKDV